MSGDAHVRFCERPGVKLPRPTRLCKNVWTLLGERQAFALTFIHVGSRKVWVSPATYHPNEQWVLQQARNLLMWLEEQGVTATHLIDDRDTQFTRLFDGLLGSSGIRIVKSPVMTLNANAFAESWIATVRRECLNHFACFSLRHTGHIVQTFVNYYNEQRPHQGVGNRTLNQQADSIGEAGQVEPVGRIGCRSELGGLGLLSSAFTFQRAVKCFLANRCRVYVCQSDVLVSMADCYPA